ncbi:MAG: tannase/feruloyl esterase family alpha/beta hydrolase [Bacteroidales bacterium]
MCRKRTYLFVFLLFSFFIGSAQNKEEKKISPKLSIAELKALALPDVTINSVELSENQKFVIVLGTISKEIEFELLLPEEWNVRFFMGGGGGFVSGIQNSMRSIINMGFATAGTNTGHEGATLKADWAKYNMERQLNFGHLAIHRTAEVSKSIIKEYYDRYPEFNYFAGCSRGGGQALMEAQRYPEDFDGIIAGAPVIDWPGTMGKFIKMTQLMYPDPTNFSDGVLSKDHLEVLQKFMLSQCDNIDMVMDNIITYPNLCKPDFSQLMEFARDNYQVEITDNQINVIKELYLELRLENKEVYPAFPWGSEANWWGWIVGPDAEAEKVGYPTYSSAYGIEGSKYLIFNDPDFDYSTYDFRDFFKDTKYADSYLSCHSFDYNKFRERNGKLIIYHGWNDAALSANTSIQHYEAIKEHDNTIDDYLKLYLLPGMNHCYGGPGPSNVDWVSLIIDWVENGNPPDRIIASKYNDKELVLSRPIYPYPSQIEYDGKGDPNIESSFIEKK